MNDVVDILIVDDEEATREGILSIPWMQHGMRVIGAAASAFDALDIIEVSPPPILILDIAMPEMDGLELLEIIRDKYSHIRVIIISGYDYFDYAQRAVTQRAFCYLLKPIDEDELIAKAVEARDEIIAQRSKTRSDRLLQEQFDASLPVLRSHFLTELTSGRVHSAHLIDRARSIGLELDLGALIVAALDIDTPHGRNDDPVQYEFRRNAVMRTAERILDDPYRCYAFHSGEHACLCFSGPSAVFEDVENRMKELIAWTNNNLAVPLTACIGPVVDDIRQLSSSAQNAKGGLQYMLVKGNNTVFKSSDISEYGNRKIDFRAFELDLVDMTAHVIRAVVNGDRAKLEEVGSRIVDLIVSYIAVDVTCKRECCFVLLSFLLDIMRTLDVDTDFFFVSGTDIMTHVRSMQTREQFESFFREFMANLHRECEARQSSSNNRLVNRARRYMDENIHEDLSLTNIAEVLGIHPNYLSRIFRRCVGVSYIEYVIDLKMKEAVRMLRETDCRISEISDRLRYRDTHYFARIFKKRVGVTPSEFRDLNL